MKTLSLNLVNNIDYTTSCITTNDGIKPTISYKACELFDGYTPKSILGLIYSKALESYICLQQGAILKKSKSDEFFEYACEYETGGILFESYEKSPCVTYVASGNGVNIYENTTEDFTIPFGFSSACYFHNRVFGVDENDRYTIFWADNLTELTGYGYVTVPSDKGEILALIPFGEYIILVRKHGLTKFKAIGASENFALTNVAGNYNICENSATVCGKYLVFLTNTTVVAFNGSQFYEFTFPYFCDIDGDFNASNIDGYYITPCFFRGQKKLFGYDLNEKSPFIIDGEYDFIAENIALGNGVTSQKVGGRTEFLSKRLTFGTGRDKRLKKVEFVSNAPMTMHVMVGVESVSQTGFDELKPNKLGKYFYINCTCDEKVKDVIAYAEVGDDI